jgi:hypothetical protein
MFAVPKNTIAAAAALAAGLAVCNPAQAALTLTADAVNLGFSLTTFATINPGSTGFGPFGIAVAPNGNVIVSNYADSMRYTFSNADGQTLGSALSSTPSNSGTQAYGSTFAAAYGTQNGQYVQFKPDGSIDHALTGVTASPYLGMWGNLTNGHLIATSFSGLIDIDPLANGGLGSFRVINGAFGDGVSVSPDGKTAFLEQGGGFATYDIATGAQLSVVGGFPGADGTGVINSTNALNGNVIVNTNFGEIWMYNPTTTVSTLLANGGTRGDYVSPDVTNGTLLLDFSDIVARLSCGQGCGIGAPPVTGVPEPETYALMLAGLGVVGFMARRRSSRRIG